MRKLFSTIIPLLGAALLISGCAGPERKLGRGMTNFGEVIRMGELRRSIEQTTVLDSPDLGFTTGAIHGFDRSMARVGVGIYEIVSFPFPNHSPNDYGPVFLPDNPVYPDSYKPNWLADTIFSTDTALGFTGGDVAPMIPGSRYHVFDN